MYYSKLHPVAAIFVWNNISTTLFFSWLIKTATERDMLCKLYEPIVHLDGSFIRELRFQWMYYQVPNSWSTVIFLANWTNHNLIAWQFDQLLHDAIARSSMLIFLTPFQSCQLHSCEKFESTGLSIAVQRNFGQRPRYDTLDHGMWWKDLDIPFKKYNLCWHSCQYWSENPARKFYVCSNFLH